MSPDEIRAAVTIDDLLEQLDLSIPSNRKVNCPVHADDTASFHLYEDHSYCFGCGFHGDVLDTLRAFTGATFGQAVQFLGGLVPDDFEPTVETKAPKEKIPGDLSAEMLREPPGSPGDMDLARRVIAERWPCLTLEDLQSYGVAVKRGGSLWIPHWHDLSMVGIKTRALISSKKSSVPGSVFTCRLYGVDPSRVGLKAVIVEGESDTWVATKLLCHKADVFGMPSGASTWKEQWLDLDIGPALYDVVYVATDPDTAGERAAEKILKSCEKKGLEAVRLVPPHGDFADSVKAGWVPKLDS